MQIINNFLLQFQLLMRNLRQNFNIIINHFHEFFFFFLNFEYEDLISKNQYCRMDILTPKETIVQHLATKKLARM